MIHKIIFEKNTLTEPQEELLVILAEESDDAIHLHDVVEISTNSESLAKAILAISEHWPARIEASHTAPVGEPKPKRKTSAPNGKCAKCFKEAVLVKASGLCKPCHMMALRAAKQIGIGQTKINRKIAARNEREAAAVERVVAKAQANGTLGMAIPLDQGKLVLSGTKVG